MTDKELEQTFDLESSDIEDNLTLPNLSESKPNATYNSYPAFLDDFNVWCAETFQTFVTGSGSEKIPKGHKHAALMYRKVKFVCVHHGHHKIKSKLCDCNFSCTCAMTCRHMMPVHVELKHEAVNPQEGLARYSRLTKNCELVYAVAVKQTALIEDDEEPEPSVMNQSQRWLEKYLRSLNRAWVN
jgi:hypothetical protein